MGGQERGPGSLEATLWGARGHPYRTPMQGSLPELLAVTGLAGEAPSQDPPFPGTRAQTWGHGAPHASKLHSYSHLPETSGLQTLLTKAGPSSAGATPTAVPPTPHNALDPAWPLSSSLQERTESESTHLNFSFGLD